MKKQIYWLYAGLGMLISAWWTYSFFINAWDDLDKVQFYVIPVGLYLLLISYMEWRAERKQVARWLDYAAIVLMVGSLFWQTLVLGWLYFFLLMAEGLVGVAYGSLRRLRRFLYAGVVAVVLSTVGQLINSLSSVNQWLAFGLVGVLLMLSAIAVERKLEDLRELQGVLETWE